MSRSLSVPAFPGAREAVAMIFARDAACKLEINF
jgi:hypothetical protein